MKISQVHETKDGSVKFEGELTPEEVGFIIHIGLNYLLRIGAIPFVKEEDGESNQMSLFEKGNFNGH